MAKITPESRQTAERESPVRHHYLPSHMDVLAPARLCKVLNVRSEAELKGLTDIELRLDTSGDQTISHLGKVFPNLLRLRLSNSFLGSFRDLGTSLHGLRVLHLQCSGVTDLDGIGGLAGLTELYLAFNDISDLGPLALHDNLEVLDLDSNAVADVNQIDQLGTCFALRVLNLKCNPVSATMLPRAVYRRIVAHHIPHLAILDDEPLDADALRPVTPAELEDAAMMCSKVAATGVRPPAGPFGAAPIESGALEELRCSNMAKRSATASRGLQSSSAAGSSALDIMDSLSSSRLGEGANAATRVISPRDRACGFRGVCVPERPATGGGVAPSSDLTHGDDAVVFAGNPVMAMRSRRATRHALPQSSSGVALARSGPEISRARGGPDFVDMASGGGDDEKEHVRRQKRPFNAWTDETIEKNRVAAISEELRHDIDTWREGRKVANCVQSGNGGAGAAGSSDSGSRSTRSTATTTTTTSNSMLDELRIFNLDLDDAEAEVAEVEEALNSPCVGEAFLAMEMRGRDGQSGTQPSTTASGPPRAAVDHDTLGASGVSTPRSCEEDATTLSDKEIVHLLRKKPKHVPHLRTRQGYRRFFSAVPKARMQRLLSAAYADLSQKDRRKKVSKRMALLGN